MSRRSRRSLTQEMAQAAESPLIENRPRTRSRGTGIKSPLYKFNTSVKRKTLQPKADEAKISVKKRVQQAANEVNMSVKKRMRPTDDEDAATNSKRKRSRSAFESRGTSTKDPYYLGSSTEDSDTPSAVQTKSFYSGRSKYLSPLERSQLKKTRNGSVSALEKKTLLKQSNVRDVPNKAKTEPLKRTVRLTNRKIDDEKEFPVEGVNTPKLRSKSSSTVPVDENYRPSKKFFKNSSPGKKFNLCNASVSCKNGFKLSFQTKKLKLDSNTDRESGAGKKGNGHQFKESENALDKSDKRLESSNVKNKENQFVRPETSEVEKNNQVPEQNIEDSSCDFDIPVANTQSENWSAISNDSCSVILLPESSQAQDTETASNRSSPLLEPDKSQAIPPKSPCQSSFTPSRYKKLKKLISSRSSSPSLQAEDFLPTPDKGSDSNKCTEEEDWDSGPEKSSADDSPKLFPIFSKASNNGNNTSSYPGTPTSASSYELASQLTPRRSPRKCSPAHTPSSSRNSAKKSTPTLWKKLKDKDDLSQMTLDFGQKLQAVEPCPTCGMTYTHGDPTDENTHAKFHARLGNTLKYKGRQNERAVQVFDDGCRIIMVLPDEKLAMRKVEAVKKIVDEDLGFVVENVAYKPHSKAFLFVSPEQKIIGFCLAELISKGYKVISEIEVQNEGSPTKRKRPWCASTESQPARCGVNRIWVLRSERRRGVASKLLDCVRFNFVMGYIIKKSEMGFSDPTPDGRQFATRYTKDENFLVYKH